MKRWLVAACCAASAASVATVARAGSVGDVAQAGVASLGAVPPSSIVVAAPLVSDVPATRGDELALRVASIVAGKIGSSAHAHAQTAPLGVARGVAGKGGALVYVQTEIAKGELRATLDVYPVQRNAWDRIRNPSPPPRAHAFASARIDAEVRAFLPAIPLDQARAHKARLDETDVLAAACGDVDGDGGMELVVVSRARVVIGKVRGDRFIASRSAAWSDLAPRLPVPMREPLGTATIARDGKVYVGTTDRGGVALNADLSLASQLRLLPLAVDDELACVDTDPAASAFATPPFDCFQNRDMNVRIDTPAPRYDAIAEARIVLRDGSSRRVIAVREPGGRVRAHVEGSAVRTIDPAGAQLAVGDLDQDGAPEIVTTEDSGEDAITIATLGGGEPKPRLRIPAPAGVRALATCPPESSGAPTLAAVVGAELWLIR